MATQDDQLERYREMRNFGETPKPRGKRSCKTGRSFVIQKHAARRLHYDLRLELDGVLKSWALTRGPSLDPADKRLAVRTEDHPLDYRHFEGVIPSGYGSGTILIWDRGDWEPDDDPQKGLKSGHLRFTLKGKRLKGGFSLIRMKGKKEKRENWLMVKHQDQAADSDADPRKRWTSSIVSDRELDAIKAGGKAGSRSGSAKGGRTAKAAKLSFVEPAPACPAGGGAARGRELGARGQV